MTTLLLLPLDERPVNRSHPALLARIGHARVITPPRELLGRFREPGDHAGLVEWLTDATDKADTAIVSVDQLLYGGLVPSRLTDEPAATVVARLAVLAALGRRVPVSAFVTITRVPGSDDATEEPPYWADYGRDLHELSGLWHRASRGEAVGDQISTSRAKVPAATVRDTLTRRLRNHTAVLAAMDLSARDLLQRLVICLDDTAQTSLSVLEADWVRRWIANLDAGNDMVVRHGADEVGSTLVARELTARQGVTPTVAAVSPAADAWTVVPPYESQSLQGCVDAQIHAVGARPAPPAAADVVLVVHPPSAEGADWALGPPPRGTPDAEQMADATAGLVADHLARGAVVAVADVAYPNGGDPSLVECLRAQDRLAPLAGYAGWNTASNTVGSVLAQAVLVAADGDRQAHRRLLTHRLVEDYGYQSVVRPQLRRWLRSQQATIDPGPSHLDAAEAYVAERLADQLRRFPGLGEQFVISPDTVRLPWGRSFGVDFELEMVAP